MYGITSITKLNRIQVMQTRLLKLILKLYKFTSTSLLHKEDENPKDTWRSCMQGKVPVSRHDTSLDPCPPGGGPVCVYLLYHYHGHHPDEPYGFSGGLQQ